MVFLHIADTRACAISEWHRPREITRSRAIRKGLSTMDREHCETIRVDRDFLFFFFFFSHIGKRNRRRSVRVSRGSPTPQHCRVPTY